MCRQGLAHAGGVARVVCSPYGHTPWSRRDPRDARRTPPPDRPPHPGGPGRVVACRLAVGDRLADAAGLLGAVCSRCPGTRAVLAKSDRSGCPRMSDEHLGRGEIPPPRVSYGVGMVPARFCACACRWRRLRSRAHWGHSRLVVG
jgi:hypothetical protein